MTELTSFGRRRRKPSNKSLPSDRLPNSVDPDVIPVTVDFRQYKARIGPARQVRWGWRDIDRYTEGDEQQAQHLSGWVRMTNFEVEEASPGFFHTYSIEVAIRDREFFAGEVRDWDTKESMDTCIRQVLGKTITVGLLHESDIPIFPEIWIGFGKKIPNDS